MCNGDHVSVKSCKSDASADYSGIPILAPGLAGVMMDSASEIRKSARSPVRSGLPRILVGLHGPPSRSQLVPFSLSDLFLHLIRSSRRSQQVAVRAPTVSAR